MAIDDFTPYIEVHASLVQNKKIYALSRILSQERTTIAGMVVFLWLWALNDCKGEMEPDALALSDIMCWHGDPTLLARALLEIKWLDLTDDGKWKIHDWDSYTGLLQERRETRKEQNRVAQSRRREKLRNLKLLTSSQHDVSMTSAARQLLVSNRTEPNRKETKRIEEKKKYKEEKQTFEEYIELIRNNYSDLDVDGELEKFKLWWSEGNKELKRPKSAFRNWLDKAQNIKNERQRNGINQQHNQASQQRVYTPGPIYTDGRDK